MHDTVYKANQMRQYKGWVAVDEEDGVTYVITDSFNIDRDDCIDQASEDGYQLAGTIPAILTVDDSKMDKMVDIKERDG